MINEPLDQEQLEQIRRYLGLPQPEERSERLIARYLEIQKDINLLILLAPSFEARQLADSLNEEARNIRQLLDHHWDQERLQAALTQNQNEKVAKEIEKTQARISKAQKNS